MEASDIKKSQLLKNEGRLCLFAETSGFSCWLNSERGNPREGAAGEIIWGGQCGQLLRLLKVSLEPWNFCYAWSGFNNSLCRIIGNWLRKWVWDIKRGKKIVLRKSSCGNLSFLCDLFLNWGSVLWLLYHHFLQWFLEVSGSLISREIL